MSEPMSEERIAEILLWLDVGIMTSCSRDTVLDCLKEITRLRAVISKQDEEISRLRGWLEEIADSDCPEVGSLNAVMWAEDIRSAVKMALRGQAPPK